MSKRDQEENADIDETNSASADGEEIEVEIKTSSSAGDEPELAASKSDEPADEEIEEIPPTLEEQLQAKEDKYLRLAAEFDNYRKRNARQFAQIIESSQAEIYSDLLTVIDNFRRALEVKNGESDFDAYRKGVELIYTQLTDFLKKNNVEPFDSVGVKFDPNLHDAMLMVQTDDFEEDTVVEEFEKGYKLRDRVLRHARVSVAKPADKAE